MTKLYKQEMKYFSAHPFFTSAVHLLIGLGLGILLTHPFIDHPVKIGGLLLVLGLAGHFYPLVAKK